MVHWALNFFYLSLIHQTQDKFDIRTPVSLKLRIQMNGCVHGSVLNTLKSRKRPLITLRLLSLLRGPYAETVGLVGERNLVEFYCNDADYTFEPVTENDKD